MKSRVRVSKKLRACLGPSLIGGLIFCIWCLLAGLVVLFYVRKDTSMAESSASGPDCNLLTNTSSNCNGPVSNSSQLDRRCAHQFYLDEESEVCLPDCREFSLYSDGGETAATVILLIASIIGTVGAVLVLALSFVNYKKVFIFPSSLIRFQTAILLIFNITILIGCTDQAFFYCKSRDLLENIINPSSFCTFTGILFIYLFWQLIIWWFSHIAAMFWGLHFPFHAHNFEVTGRTKYIHITVIVLGLFVPIGPVVAAVGTGGFVLTRFPAISCDAQSLESSFYAGTLPIGFMAVMGLTLLILLFWTIYKENRAVSIAREKGRAPEIKVLIIICYFGTTTVFTLVAAATALLIGFSSSAITSYVYCEANGIQANSTMTCDRSQLDEMIPIQVMFDIKYVLFLLIPIVNLTYALKIRDLRALQQRCMKCCPWWCVRPTTDRKQSAGSAVTDLSSV